MYPTINNNELDLSPLDDGSTLCITHPDSHETEHPKSEGVVVLSQVGKYQAGVRRENGKTYRCPDFVVPASAEVQLQKEREGMVVSPLQGRLVLGPEVCAQIDALASDPATPWAMRETINRASVWERTSQTMDELAYLLGYTDEEMDQLFRIAMTIRV